MEPLFWNKLYCRWWWNPGEKFTLSGNKYTVNFWYVLILVNIFFEGITINMVIYNAICKFILSWKWYLMKQSLLILMGTLLVLLSVFRA